MNILETHIVRYANPWDRFSDFAVGLFAAFPSKKTVKKAIKRGELRVDGEVVGTGHFMKKGMEIQWIEIEKPLPKIFPITMNVVHEDEECAVIVKPAGLPTSGNYYKTVQNALLHNLTPSTQKDALQLPLPVHRLDRATSGLLIIAKTRSARMELGRQFEGREIEKRYRAVVIGKMDAHGFIDEPLEGKEALTRYECVDTTRSLRSEWLSLVDLYPLTGRTHQLRIHLSTLGNPILGDPLYGIRGLILKNKGLFLSAVELTFSHPLTEAEMDFKIPEPPKFKAFMHAEQKRFDKYGGGFAPGSGSGSEFRL